MTHQSTRKPSVSDASIRRGRWWVRGLASGLALLVVGLTVWTVHSRRARPKDGTDGNDGPAAGDERRPTTLPSVARQETYARVRAQVAQVMKTAPERLSPDATIEPFDPASFAHDAEAYLSKIVPARCYQTARPGVAVPILDVASPLRTQVSWGEDVFLMAKTLPRAPVTFTAFGGGHFSENGISSLSVRADARGFASVHYAPDQGIEGDVSVIAGSPVVSGTQRFYIRVNPTRVRTGGQGG